MSKRYALGKALRKRGRPMKALAPATALTRTTPEPASLPLPAPEPLALPASDAIAVIEQPQPPAKVDNPYKLPANSKLKKQVVRILALRTRGYSLAQIGEAMVLSTNTIRGYLYRAGKNGWLEDLDDPTDHIEHDVLHKVVRNMGQALDSDDPERRDHMTLEIAKGTVFKRFDPQQSTQMPALTMLSVRIEHVEGTMTTTRPGAIVGKPAFIDGAVEDEA